MDREALGAGAAQAAAELRAHLGVITAASQVLERSVPGGKERTYLAAVNQSVCQMLRLIGRLELGFRLTDEDEIRAKNATLDLGPWLRGLGLRLTSVLAAVGVEFRLEFPESQLMYGDRLMLQQMLLELVPAAAEGASQVSLTVTAGGQEVSFLVRGNGPVRTAEQLDALTAEQPVGAVSGVALARSIAELHGGTLAAEAPAEGGLTLAASVPVRADRITTGRLESPEPDWRPGGFDPALIALSDLLPASAFLPEELG